MRSHAHVCIHFSKLWITASRQLSGSDDLGWFYHDDTAPLMVFAITLGEPRPLIVTETEGLTKTKTTFGVAIGANDIPSRHFWYVSWMVSTFIALGLTSDLSRLT